MKHRMACGGGGGGGMELLLLFLLCNIAITRGGHVENLCSSSWPSYNFDYKEVLANGILFFEGQRSGQLPPTQRVRWRGDSALFDGIIQDVNLTGGYYDAGDNVKFTWPMAYSATLLSWAAIDYQWELSSTNQLGYLRTTIEWATDYLLKAHTSSMLYTQVGDGNVDHQCWERPEDMDTPRTLYKIDHRTPGSEVAAEVAAALAAASIVFEKVHIRYSEKLLRHARVLFEFADKYRASYQSSCPFYCSYSGYQDELLWAAAWLYKATGEKYYLKYVDNNQGWSHAVSEFSWDNKFAGVQTLLAKEFLTGNKNLSNYKSDADAFVCALMPGSNFVQIKTTPGGLLYIRESNNIQYATGATMILLYYSNVLNTARSIYPVQLQCGSVSFTASEIAAFAKSQIDYILGNNPLKMSYMVGFGSKYPTQLHHRGSSIPSKYALPDKVGCANDWYSSPKPNPNIHVGAIVGGPDYRDQFQDVRSDYNHLEPTTYTNAAFVASVSALLGQLKQECLKMPHQENVAHSTY